MSYYDRTKYQQATRTAAEAANEREASRRLDDDLGSLGHPPVALANVGHGRLTLAEASALGAFIAAAAERAGLLDDLRAVLLAVAMYERDGEILGLFGVNATRPTGNIAGPKSETFNAGKLGSGFSAQHVRFAQRDGSPVPTLRDPHAAAEEMARRMVRRLADATPEDDE
jgi:hypothetical protein